MADTTAAIDDSSDNSALEEAKLKLLKKAKKDKKIDQREILSTIPDIPENVDILDSLYTELADKNITVTSGAGDTADWQAEEPEETVLNEQVYLDDIADDSVRLYLCEIGKIPLLQADEELALANRVV